MKSPVLISTLLLFTGMSAHATTIYQCINSNGHTTFQNTSACPQGSKQTVLNYPTSNTNPTDGLRDYELTKLERFHNMDYARLESQLDLEREYALAEQQHENLIDYENLRHEQAKEMFDKHYRHFWVYGYANGQGNFPLVYSVDSINRGTDDAPADPISTPPVTPSPLPTVPGTSP